MISVIIPTYSEAVNSPILIPMLHDLFQREALEGEIIVVEDNSSDGTANAAYPWRLYCFNTLFDRRQEET